MTGTGYILSNDKLDIKKRVRLHKIETKNTNKDKDNNCDKDGV